MSFRTLLLATPLLSLALLAGCSCSPAAKVEIPDKPVPLPPPGAATTLGGSGSLEASPPAKSK